MNLIEVPYMGLRGSVLFPQTYLPLYIGREFTIKNIEYAKKQNQARILVLTQKKTETNEPRLKSEFYSIGTICNIEQAILLQDKTMKILMHGEQLFKVHSLFEKNGIKFAKGYLIKNSAKSKKIKPELKDELLELIIKHRPMIALDKDDNWLNRIKNENNLDQFLCDLQNLLNRGRFSLKALHKQRAGVAKTPALNQINKKALYQQKILEELNLIKRAELIKTYLKSEIIEEVKSWS